MQPILSVHLLSGQANVCECLFMLRNPAAIIHQQGAAESQRLSEISNPQGAIRVLYDWWMADPQLLLQR